MTTPARILELLYDRRQMHVSLPELAALAGVGPRQVQRGIVELRGRGHSIEHSPLGLRLAEPILLDANLIERGLQAKRVGRNVICFGEVGSTNDIAFDSARQEGSDGLAVFAESQKAGRGRLGRRWVSPPRQNILMSVLLRDPQSRLSHEALTIAAGLAGAEAVEEVASLDVQVKWPNDLEIDGAKLGGILVEMKSRVGAASGAALKARRPRIAAAALRRDAAAPAADKVLVIGIGLNANASPPANSIGRPATNMADHLGHRVERIELARTLLRRLDHWVERIEKGSLASLHRQWMARCEMINQRLGVASGGRQYVGRVVDVSPLEGLVLALDDGTTVQLPGRSSSIVVQ